MLPVQHRREHVLLDPLAIEEYALLVAPNGFPDLCLLLLVSNKFWMGCQGVWALPERVVKEHIGFVFRVYSPELTHRLAM